MYKELQELQELKKAYKKHLNRKVKYLVRSKYKGKGRPKKTDYILIKIKDIPDFEAAQILFNGFKTSYIGDGQPLFQD